MSMPFMKSCRARRHTPVTFRPPLARARSRRSDRFGRSAATHKPAPPAAPATGSPCPHHRPLPPVASHRGREHRPVDHRRAFRRRDRPSATGSRRCPNRDGRRDEHGSWRTPFTPWRGDVLDAAPFRIGGGSPVKSPADEVTSRSPVRGPGEGKRFLNVRIGRPSRGWQGSGRVRKWAPPRPVAEAGPPGGPTPGRPAPRTGFTPLNVHGLPNDPPQEDDGHHVRSSRP